METFFRDFVVQFPTLFQYKYFILFFAATFEGFNVFLVAGFLISVGIFAPVPTVFVVLAGEVLSGYLWYSIGYYGGGKSIDFFLRHRPNQQRFMERVRLNLENYNGAIILLAKMTWSLTIATLIMTGSLKYSLRKFSVYNIIGSLGWVAVTLFVGYTVGQGYQLYVESFKNVILSLILVTLALTVIILIWKVSKKMLFYLLGFSDTLRNVSEKIQQQFDYHRKTEE
jgi:membrane-associated protein